MATRSPFARRRSRGHPKPFAPPEQELPRRKTLVSHCHTCGQTFAFEADQMNNGGMYQLDRGANRCPHCKTEAEEVYTLSPESFRLEAAEEAQAIGAGPEVPSGKVYKRAALSRNTASMGMAPVEGTEE